MFSLRFQVALLVFWRKHFASAISCDGNFWWNSSKYVLSDNVLRDSTQVSDAHWGYNCEYFLRAFIVRTLW